MFGCKRKRIAELEEENKRLHVLNDLRVKKVESKDGKLDMTIEDPSGMLQLVVSCMVENFNREGGVNYVEWTVAHAETGETYSFLMQKRFGKTPAEINDELQGQVKKLEKAIRDHRDEKASYNEIDDVDADLHAVLKD